MVLPVPAPIISIPGSKCAISKGRVYSNLRWNYCCQFQLLETNCLGYTPWRRSLGNTKKIAMLTKKFFTRLLLCAAIVLPQYAFPATFCPVTSDGKIRIDECKYSSNEACKRASESQRDCVADQLEPSTKAPYCLVLGWYEICDKYYDYESCELAANKQAGNCIVSPYYKGPDK